MLASAHYLNQQTQLHELEHYGNTGTQWAYLVAGIRAVEQCSTVLDYGCGKGFLGNTLRNAGLSCVDYDPALPQFSGPPPPCDLVACTDVLEHIEPDCIDAVVIDLARVTKRLLFVAICLRPAVQVLPDGRNAHLLIKDKKWWQEKLGSVGFKLRRDWPSDEWWIALLKRKR